MDKDEVFVVFKKRSYTVGIDMKFKKHIIKLKRSRSTKHSDWFGSDLFISLKKGVKGSQLIIKQRPNVYHYAIPLWIISLGVFGNEKPEILFPELITILVFMSYFFYSFFYFYRDQQYIRETIEKWFDPFIQPLKPQ